MPSAYETVVFTEAVGTQVRAGDLGMIVGDDGERVAVELAFPLLGEPYARVVVPRASVRAPGASDLPIMRWLGDTPPDVAAAMHGLDLHEIVVLVADVPPMRAGDVGAVVGGLDAADTRTVAFTTCMHQPVATLVVARSQMRAVQAHDLGAVRTLSARA